MFAIGLDYGESETITTNGPISVVADCVQSGGDDMARLLAETTVDGALMNGVDDRNGSGIAPSGGTLDTTSAADDRELVRISPDTGTVLGATTIDQAWVLAPTGEAIHLNSEGIVLAVNYGDDGHDCIISGTYAVSDI